jgi:hypothetical protein
VEWRKRRKEDIVSPAARRHHTPGSPSIRAPRKVIRKNSPSLPVRLPLLDLLSFRIAVSSFIRNPILGAVNDKNDRTTKTAVPAERGSTPHPTPAV